MTIGENDTNTTDWYLGGIVGQTSYGSFVPAGRNIAIELRFSQESKEATFVYDPDIEDDAGGYVFGPFPVSTIGLSTRFLVISGGLAELEGVLDSWTYESHCDANGDFDQNGTLDIEDIDRLTAVVRAGTNDKPFDLNDDGSVDESDRRFWVTNLKETFFGDANLDFQFNSSDLLLVFQRGEYDDLQVGSSTWGTGDWNGDGDFDSRDLVFAFQEGAYEQGARATPNVPESEVPTFLAVGVIGWFGRRVLMNLRLASGD